MPTRFRDGTLEAGLVRRHPGGDLYTLDEDAGKLERRQAGPVIG